ncbi:MAG: zinc ribbon domain-containing protein [Phycisphaerae bacterium]|jgi:putative FmdB family regulatory protein|nr:zinc ribbon domain-containing protein [Phycisphaerae bacterium]
MPTYEYRCGACAHSFELFQSIKARSVRKCPQCGKLKVKRLIGIGAGVIFKGSGFYQTDYRSESYRKAAEKDKAPKVDKKTDSTKDGAKTKPAKTSD